MKIIQYICFAFLIPGMSCSAFKNAGEPCNIRVSDSGRFIIGKDNNPFFWLADTGWLLFSKLTREEAELYLEDRKQKGFNVIQVMVLHDVKKAVNVYGDSALVNCEANQPLLTEGSSFIDSIQYDYWDHVDFIIETARKKGLYMALVPVWGSNIKSGNVSQNQALNYIRWLAERYKSKSNVIWLNGGDIKGSDSTETWKKIGHTLKSVCPEHLVSFHPFGRTKSSEWFHNENWLDFNMFQSGHRRYNQDTTGLCYGEDNWKYVCDDYNKIPIKPTLDGEPSYEGIPQGLHDPSQPYWTDDDIRRYAYWSVLSGACGFTYGNNAIMQFHKENDKNPAYGVKKTWKEALNDPGACQMKYLKKLMETYSFSEAEPAQYLLSGINGEKYDYITVLKGKNFALFYTHNGRDISVDFKKLNASKIVAFWYNPRDGKKEKIGGFSSGSNITFNPPGNKKDGDDYVLVLEF
ncbi:MAG: glycoside hydrolase family 140 protein [Prolixibacteraceae bacterium]|nr:glycoside hydrolase family 140 protein [Prolixibacteraceae bacterium]